MCGIILTNKKISNIDYVNYFLKFRGPDDTNVINKDDFTLVHNQLHITGEKTKQPFVDNGIYCIYNGEIYNYKDFGNYDSDGLCIIDLYKKHGEDFVKHLDGEFAIIILDTIKNKIIAATDIFATKPLWISIENGEIGITSYKSCLDRLGFIRSKQIISNKLIVINLENYETKKVQHETKKVQHETKELQYKIKKYHTFDLKQYKDTFDDWNKAFENAIKKRTLNTTSKIVVGLSSGHDSGAICCALEKLNKKYKGVSVMSGENLDVIKERLDRNNGEFIKVFEKRFSEVENEIEKNCEYITYIQSYNTKHEVYRDYGFENFHKDGRTDPGALGLACVLKSLRIKGKDYKINLSGIGGDEHYNTEENGKYGGGWNPSTFIENLESIFPWKNFNEGVLRNYLNMNEYIGGMYGFESRYPFLDKNVVQEFLWLKHTLKNKYKYKAPIHNYLLKNKYPINLDEKHAFDTDVVQLKLYMGTIENNQVIIEKYDESPRKDKTWEFRWKCITENCEHNFLEKKIKMLPDNNCCIGCSNFCDDKIFIDYLKNGIYHFIVWKNDKYMIITPLSLEKTFNPKIDTNLQLKFIKENFKDHNFGELGDNCLCLYVDYYRYILEKQFAKENEKEKEKEKTKALEDFGISL